MNTTVTDEQIRQLAQTAKPYSLALLWWGPERYMEGAETTELEHQRRMVSLRADGVIAILCPVASETLAGVQSSTCRLSKPENSWTGIPACGRG